MSEASSTTKRKRSAIACTVCHDRKVRCNVAINGVPCSNCQTDGTPCRIYGRRPSVGPERAIRPKLNTADDALYPPTPSTVVSSVATGLQNDQTGRTPSNGIVTRTEPTPHETNTSIETDQRQRSPTPADGPLVPYHAGEAEGLDFLFDVCHPNRPFKGTVYIINRQRARFADPEVAKVLESKPLPSPAVCRELVRLYFAYVHPFLPIIDAADFVQTFHEDVKKVSTLLLWSVLFAAASFVGSTILQETGFSGRKALREYFYGHAKALYDAQVETEKTTIIQSVLLLGYYYIDLEDLDGSWHWLGVAIGLCHGIGLYRDAGWHRLQRSPFSPTQYAVWRRIWWCCYCRDAWLALGLGRPMRTHIEDMDTPMPTLADVLDELDKMPPDLRQAYIPVEMPTLAALWSVFMQLSEKLEQVMNINYRIRRPPVVLSTIEQYDTEIWQLYQQVHEIQVHQQPTRLQTLHTHLLKTYYNSIVIALFRPYIVNPPPEMPKDDQERLQPLATDRCRLAASNTTYSLNELVSSDLIDVCPTMLSISMMSTMQIHFYEHYNLEGLSRQHALHNLKLHLMVLEHLRKTYWSADMQHKLFTEALKAMENPVKCTTSRASSKEGEPTSASTQPGHVRPEDLPVPMEGHNVHDFDLTDPHTALGTEGLDDFFVTFNPFNSSLTTFNDWVLGNEP